MKLDLDQHNVGIPCPGCGQEVTETVGKLKESPDLTCSNCAARISVDATELTAGLDRVQQSLTAMEKQMREAFK
jgi:transcription elongation factor Elf1